MPNQPYPKAIVGCLVLNPNGDVFLMRSSGKYGDQWIIPGGKIDFGEGMEAALRREIREETGLELDQVNFCGVRELIEPERHFVFLEFRAAACPPFEVQLNQEATEWAWVAKADLKTLDVATPTLELLKEHWL